MITVYGMNEKLGNLSYHDAQNEYGFQKPFSEETAKLIDQEVRALIETAFRRTKELLIEKKAQLEILAQELLKKEILFQHDLEVLIGKRPFEHKPAFETEATENGTEKKEVAAEPEKEVPPPITINPKLA
jgi:cell division protease FtsH